MANPLKKIIFDYQLNKCHKDYEKRIIYLGNPYGRFIESVEGKKDKTYIGTLEGSKNREVTSKVIGMGDMVMVVLGEGYAELPFGKFEHSFDDRKLAFAYCDEDCFDSCVELRYGPYMKPDYSPDTLLSFFYVGSLLFFSKKYLDEAVDKYKDNYKSGKTGYSLLTFDELNVPTTKKDLYDFLLFFTEYCEEKELLIKHIPQVLFHRPYGELTLENPKEPEFVCKENYWGYEETYNSCKENAFFRRGIEASLKKLTRENKIVVGNGIENEIETENETGIETEIVTETYFVPAYPVLDNKLVSIVIPSKDNVDVLTTCIKSVYEITNYKNFEIILVDNGSSEENKEKLQQLKEKYPFQYIYEPMTFNFSKMCNLGVSHAKGEYILLLNDDMEILQSDWLEILLGQAMIPHVGAVGAKLLYPNTSRIQHAGITNLWVGPAHMLLKEDDSIDFYYGRNVLPYDMIGVTAACLMVSKEKYEEVGGLCEDIAVSYNDVDFCFSLFDHGYFNVARNDVVLYHHESISRGDDTLSDEKWDRLLHEKDFVYSRHKSLEGKDPFHNPNLAGFKSKYFCSFLYPYEERLARNSLKPFNKAIPESWYNNCLTETVEHIRLERKLNLTDEIDVYWIEGWAYVLGMDSSRYRKTLILEDESGNKFEVEPFERLRSDVVDILPEQVNVALSGFSARLRKEDLKKGAYQVSILFRDRCSRQCLYKVCEEKLVVE